MVQLIIRNVRKILQYESMRASTIRSTGIKAAQAINVMLFCSLIFLSYLRWICSCSRVDHIYIFILFACASAVLEKELTFSVLSSTIGTGDGIEPYTAS